MEAVISRELLHLSCIRLYHLRPFLSPTRAKHLHPIHGRPKTNIEAGKGGSARARHHTAITLNQIVFSKSGAQHAVAVR